MSDRDLTILCVTKREAYAQPFLARLAQDAAIVDAHLNVIIDGAGGVQSRGYIESVLDQALETCADGYVLRVDDDETLSLQLLEWLRRREYRRADHWAFPRRNLWPDGQHHIANPPLWPDLQTRLSVKAKAGERRGIHDGSPYGTGTIAGCPIDHHKFLARTAQERGELVRHYEALQPGAGVDYLMFSMPEMYEDELQLEAIR